MQLQQLVALVDPDLVAACKLQGGDRLRGQVQNQHFAIERPSQYTAVGRRPGCPDEAVRVLSQRSVLFVERQRALDLDPVLAGLVPDHERLDPEILIPHEPHSHHVPTLAISPRSPNSAPG
jgi:hypothetical protein